MIASRRSLRAFLSGAFAPLLLASIVAAQDKPSTAAISLDPAELDYLTARAQMNRAAGEQ